MEEYCKPELHRYGSLVEATLGPPAGDTPEGIGSQEYDWS